MQTAHGQILALHGDDHLVGRRQGVDREQPEARRRVDADEVVVVLDRAERLLQRALTADLRGHRDLGAGEVDRRARDVDLALADDLPDVGVVDEHVVHRRLEGVRVDPLRHGQVPLGVHVHAEHPVALLGEGGREVQRRRRLRHATLLVGERDHLCLGFHARRVRAHGRGFLRSASGPDETGQAGRRDACGRQSRPLGRPGAVHGDGPRRVLRRRRAGRRRDVVAAARRGGGGRARRRRRRGQGRPAPAVPPRVRRDHARAPRRARDGRGLLAASRWRRRATSPSAAASSSSSSRPTRPRCPPSCTTASTSSTRRSASRRGSATWARGCAPPRRCCGPAAGSCSSTCTRCWTPWARSTRSCSTSRTRATRRTSFDEPGSYAARRAATVTADAHDRARPRRSARSSRHAIAARAARRGAARAPRGRARPARRLPAARATTACCACGSAARRVPVPLRARRLPGRERCSTSAWSS